MTRYEEGEERGEEVITLLMTSDVRSVLLFKITEKGNES